MSVTKKGVAVLIFYLVGRTGLENIHRIFEI